MDLKSAQAELSAIQLKLSNIVDGAKAANRDLTASEAATIEKDADRAIQLKAAIVGLKNADTTGRIGASTAGQFDSFNGQPEGNEPGAKGFLSASGIKSAVKATVAPGIKALIANGSTATPTTLETEPIKLGSADSLGLLSFIPVKVRETPNYSYNRQSIRTSNAAVVAPGATKPTSVFTAETVPGSLAVYAHLSEYVDRFVLEDADDLEAFLESELRNGVLRKVTADAIAAFAGAAGVNTVVTSATYSTAKGVDAIYDAASKITQLGFTPNLVVVPAAIYDAIRLSKSTTGEYIGGSPFEGPGMTGLWGLPVLASPDVAANTGLVLDTSKVGISIDKQGLRTDWDAISGFAKNEVRARTEGRYGFDVKVPKGITKITFTA